MVKINPAQLAGLTLAGPALAFALAGCTPQPAPTPPRPSTSAPKTPAASPTSPRPTPSPTSVAAAGSMYLFTNLVSDRMSGTCGRVDGEPTLAVADLANEFFDGVQAVVVLEGEQVKSLSVAFGEDSEGIKRRLEYDAELPEEGASAKVTAKGATYQVNGAARMYEGGMAADLTPFKLTVRCASTDW